MPRNGQQKPDDKPASRGSIDPAPTGKSSTAPSPTGRKSCNHPAGRHRKGRPQATPADRAEREPCARPITKRKGKRTDTTNPDRTETVETYPPAERNREWDKGKHTQGTGENKYEPEPRTAQKHLRTPDGTSPQEKDKAKRRPTTRPKNTRHTLRGGPDPNPKPGARGKTKE